MTSRASGQRRKQSDRRAEAERRLMVAAAELIGEVGPDRMRLADIGERAGYSRGLATHYFGTKGNLVRRILQTVTEEFHQELAQHDQAEGIAGVKDIVSTYLRRLRDDEPMIRARIALWAAAAAGGGVEERDHAVEADERFRREISARLERGLITGVVARDVDVSGFTTILIGMLRGSAVQYLLDDTIDLAAVEAEAVAFIEGRLTPQG